jgi:hypothetical protein
VPHTSLRALALATTALLAAGAAAAQTSAPPAPVGQWAGGPVTPPGAGGPAYCATQNQYDSGLALVLARNPQGETNIGISVPGAEFAQGTRFPVQVSVDGGTERQFDAVAADGSMILIQTGRDGELYEQLRRGSRLTVRGPDDDAIFALKGTSQALADLQTCAERIASGAPAQGPGQAQGQAQGPGQGQARPPLPPSLAAVLARSGLTEVQVLNLDAMPQDKRPADYAWRFDGVFGGVREFDTEPGATIAELSEQYLASMKQACPGTFEAVPAEPTQVGQVGIRTAEATCTATDRKINVSMLLYLTGNGIFTVFFNEADDSARQRAVEARDGLARAIRELAEREATGQQGPG